jgi:xylan 1,4-beta-xylosidase
MTRFNIFLILFFGFNYSFPQSIGYQNPVIPGFYPDPSVCRVGEDYYLVNSSFEYFPGVPIFHSKDLIHWEQIGYCLTRKSQLNLEKIQASLGIYAPTIRYNNGVFYMIVTNISHGGNFYVYTSDPAGEWSDPVWIDQTGIDPSLFFDDDGKVYYTGNTPWGVKEQGIYQFEIDIKTGKKLTESRFIWTGTGGRYPEGPHLYKINGLYYLMISEGGTEYGHMETIARSKSPWGPFESCPGNPILTHRGRNAQSNPIQGTGHADLVLAADGSWWMVHLAFRTSSGQWHQLGRETFLVPVEWTTDGWPVVNGTGTTNLKMNVKTLSQDETSQVQIRNDFNEDKLGFEWNYLRNPDLSLYSLSEKKGWLSLKGNHYTIDSLASPGFIGRRQQHFNCTVTTKMNFSPADKGEESGITVLMNNSYHYDLAVIREDDGKKYLVLRYTLGHVYAESAKIEISSKDIWLKIISDPQYYNFSYSLNGKEFKNLSKAETRLLSSEVAGGFTGVYFGLYATGNGKNSLSPAYFDWFEYDGK